MYLKLSYLQGILQNISIFGVKGLEESPSIEQLKRFCIVLSSQGNNIPFCFSL